MNDLPNTQFEAGERLPFGPLTRSNFNFLAQSFNDPEQFGTQMIARARGIRPDDYYRVLLDELLAKTPGPIALEEMINLRPLGHMERDDLMLGSRFDDEDDLLGRPRIEPIKPGITGAFKYDPPSEGYLGLQKPLGGERIGTPGLTPFQQLMIEKGSGGTAFLPETPREDTDEEAAEDIVGIKPPTEPLSELLERLGSSGPRYEDIIGDLLPAPDGRIIKNPPTHIDRGDEYIIKPYPKPIGEE